MLASALMTIIREDFLDDVSDADAGYASDARWSDAFILRQIGQAQRQACYRSDLRHLFDATTADICTIALTAGTQTYALDPRILRLHEVRHDNRVLLHTSQARLDEVGHNWRSTLFTRAPGAFFVHQRTLTLDAAPISGALSLAVWREPLEDPEDDSELEWLDDQEQLGHWVAYKAFLMPDEDLSNPQRAQMHLEAFNAAFGMPMTARERLDILGSPPDLWLHPRMPYAQPAVRRLPFDIDT
jgi:hypothetical protein